MKQSIRVCIFILALLTALSVFACNTPSESTVTAAPVAEQPTVAPTPAATQVPAEEVVIVAVTDVPKT